MMTDITIKRGQIYYADLSPARGSEQGGVRPVLIVQNDIGNKHSPTVIMCPLTTQIKNPLPTHVTLVGGICAGSTVLCEQVRTIDKSRLKKYMTTLTCGEMNRVSKALAISLNLI